MSLQQTKQKTGWWQYDERTCIDIEEAYKKGDKFCTILVAGYVYVVDFESMLQQRQNDPARKRQVKRDLATIPKKGVAGLRIDGSTDHVPSGGSTPTLDGGGGAAAAADDDTATNIISTIAANAAIRIASDIIDSTLAHADEYHRSSSINMADQSSSSAALVGAIISGTSPTTSILSNSSSGSSIEFNRRELLDEVEETLNMSNAAASSSINSPPNLEDFFSLTIDEFRSLALTNIAESSSDDDSDENDNDDNDCNL